MATDSVSAARLAVLIDADNTQASITEALLAEVAKYGTGHVTRAHGDWTATNLAAVPFIPASVRRRCECLDEGAYQK